jgi:hypothetical protein
VVAVCWKKGTKPRPRLRERSGAEMIPSDRELS